MPDPVEALKAILAFDQEVFERLPDVELVHLYTYPDSPGEGVFTRDVMEFTLFHWIEVAERTPSFDLSEVATVGIEDAAGLVPGRDREAAPPGSVVLSYVIVFSPAQRVNRETGEVGESFGEDRFNGTSILTPTEAGWQLFFIEAVGAP
jgi:hypothetical protein